MTEQSADVFVIFGITGDLAKVMTFRSLYRLERRGLLDCPIVGVAVNDWTVDQLVERARESIVGTGESLDEEVFGRLAKRFSYVSGDFDDDATYERVGDAIKGKTMPVFYLEIPPFLFGRVVKGLTDAGLTKTARVVVEKPFGHDLESAKALAKELHQYIDESQLYRIDHYLGKMGLEEILYLRFANTMLEPLWSRNYLSVGADHDGRGLRRRRSRPLLRPGRGAARRGRQPPHAGGRRVRDGAALARRPADDQGLAGGALPRHQRRRPRALRPWPVRRLPPGRRRRAGLDDRDVRRASARDRELALGRRAVLHPHREVPARRRRPSFGSSSSTPPRLGFAMFDRHPEPNALVVRLDPTTGIRLEAQAHRADKQGASEIALRHGVLRGRG